VSESVTLPSGRTTLYETSGTGTPLVLIHGAESARGQFDDFMPALAPGIRAISYDQRDTAPDDVGNEQYDIGLLADDLAEFLTALGVPAAHVLGTSFGGAVAQHFALRHPERVRSLTLAATFASAAPLTAFAARTTGKTPQEMAVVMGESGVSPQAAAADTGLPGRLQAALVVRAPAQQARRRHALLAHDVESRLAAITAPTLVVHGTDDPIVPFSSAETIAALIPGAALVPLEGGRHAVSLEFRDRLAGLVSEFVLARCEVG
jgi:3-oxoadipate enol-lactonase